MLFNNPKQIVIAICFFIAVFVLSLGGWKCAHATGSTDPPYMQFSAGSTYIRGPAPVICLAATWPSTQAPRNFWKLDLDVIGSSTLDGHSAPNNFALRGLYVSGFRYLDIGLGLGWIQNPRPYNGSPVNFTLEVAYRFRALPVTLTVSHISNAGTQSPNLGRDFVTLGYRFKG